MKICNFGRIVVLMAACVCCSSTRAATIAGYLFDGQENGVDSQPLNTGTGSNSYLPSVVSANVTASRITAPGAGAAGSATVRLGVLASLGYPSGNVLLSSTQGLGDTNSPSHYFTVTIEPNAGYAIDLQDLRLQAARGGGSDRGFRVRSSLDGFATTLNGAETLALATQRPTMTPYTVDLSSPAFNAITAPIEFRFYPYSTAPNNTIEFDNVVLNGTVNQVSQVPEAASLTLMMTALICACGTRRRSK
jgi:hypothetical protein